jgi:predicted phosphodiesterase
MTLLHPLHDHEPDNDVSVITSHDTTNGTNSTTGKSDVDVTSNSDVVTTTPTTSSSSSSSSTNHGLPFHYHHLTNIERIFCLSDLHTDHIDNLHWLQQQTYAANFQSTDLIIIAGDISHQISTFQETMSIFLHQYQCQVLFVPGNHEAWLSSTSSSSSSSSSSQDSNITTSFEKLQQIYDLCRTMGVYVDPVYVSGRHTTDSDDNDKDRDNTLPVGHPVWILPLQSWYDGTLTFDEKLCEGFDKWPWMDFIKCQWDPQRFVPSTLPQNARIPQGLVEHFLQCNHKNIIVPFQQLIQEQPHLLAPCITVSHFAPNQQCLPDWKNISDPQFNIEEWLDHGAGTMSAKFAKVAGTQQLDDQIRTLLSVLPTQRDHDNTTTAENASHHLPPSPQNQLQNQHQPQHQLIHIFGHSHRPKDFVYNQIRYIHNPLGKPRERQLHMISPNVTFQYIWNSRTAGEISGPTIIRYWEQYGGGKEMLWQRMSSTTSSKSSSSQIPSNNTGNASTTMVEIQGGRYRSSPPSSLSQ